MDIAGWKKSIVLQSRLMTSLTVFSFVYLLVALLRLGRSWSSPAFSTGSTVLQGLGALLALSLGHSCWKRRRELKQVLSRFDAHPVATLPGHDLDGASRAHR